MAWWKKKKLIPTDVALSLLSFSADFVRDAMVDIEAQRRGEQQSGAGRMTNELMYLSLFALDYHISNHAASQQTVEGIREALYYHWRQGLGHDAAAQIMWEDAKQRLREYARIVNDAQSDEAEKVLALGTKLSEFCGCPGYSRLVILAPFLFRAALDAVGVALRGTK